MNECDALRSDYDALNDLIVRCPDLEEIERLLGGFNVFQVLKFEYGEIRHSNVLAWILDPSESHGLDEAFLRKWMMKVIHEASDTELPIGAVDIDTWQLVETEVRREWRHIDVLVILRFANGASWVLCIENKVNSTQRRNQLSDYRKVVENEFPDAEHRLFFFLTKNEEEAEDRNYIPASYSQVHSTLKECVSARQHQIGAGPLGLLDDYIRLLEEKFMDQSQIAELARRIYKQHKRALDVIIEHRPDSLQHVSDELARRMGDSAEDLGIILGPCSKYLVRFIPTAWEQPGNQHGTGWAPCPWTILFEIDLRGRKPSLKVVAGKSPEAWIEPIWKRAQDPSCVFKAKRGAKGRPKEWVTLHHVLAPSISVEDADSEDPGVMAERIAKWCSSRLRSEEIRQVIEEIAIELPRLDEICRTQAS